MKLICNMWIEIRRFPDLLDRPHLNMIRDRETLGLYLDKVKTRPRSQSSHKGVDDLFPPKFSGYALIGNAKVGFVTRSQSSMFSWFWVSMWLHVPISIMF
jgi:hypothetical protein